MDTTAQKISSLNARPDRESRISIMIMGSMGKVRSLKISPHIILLTTIFFLIYIPCSILIINSYFKLHRLNSIQSKKIKQLERINLKNKKMLHGYKQMITMLEAEYKQNFKVSREEISEPVSVSDSNKKMADSVEAHVKKNKGKEKKPKKVVDIKDMVIKENGSTMNVNFKVVKMDPGESVVGGYIHIIAESEKSNPPNECAYPKEKLLNGTPVDFRCGQLFFIRRFKPIQGKFNLVPDSDLPDSINVLVYNQSGELILKKGFDVGNVS